MLWEDSLEGLPSYSVTLNLPNLGLVALPRSSLKLGARGSLLPISKES